MGGVQNDTTTTGPILPKWWRSFDHISELALQAGFKGGQEQVRGGILPLARCLVGVFLTASALYGTHV